MERASGSEVDAVMLQGSVEHPWAAPVLVWWPEEAVRLHELRDRGVMRLVVVQADAEPPISGDPLEDWVRSSDVASIPARIASLVARAEPFLTPHLDPTGVLRVGARSTPLSPAEIPIVRRLIDHFGSIVPTRDIAADAGARDDALNRTSPALRQRMRRIREHVREVGLDLRTVPRRGYVLLRHVATGPGNLRFA